MAREQKAYVGEIGKRIIVTVGKSLQNVASVILYVEKPDGTVAVAWTATVLGPVANGQVYYNTIANDLSIKGQYRLYAKVTYGDGSVFFGTRTWFQVYEPSTG